MMALAATIPQTSPHSSVAETRHPTTLVSPPWKHTLGLNRVRQLHLDIYSGYRKTFSNPKGVAAVKLFFNDKEGGADDDELTVFGVNQDSGEIFYNKSMVSLGFFGREKESERVLIEALGVAADDEGNVFVADRGAHRIVRLRMSEDNVLQLVDSFNLEETGTSLRSPAGVAVENGELFITDTGNNRIAVTDLDGNYVTEIGQMAGLNEPFGIAVISSGQWNYFASRFIAVTDSQGERLILMSLRGAILDSVSYSEVSDAGGGFYFVAIDYYSNIYVTDSVGGCLFKFDRRSNFLTREGCGSSTKRDLVEPRGIAIHRRYGQIFVAEKSGASYFWVGTDIQNIRSRAKRQGDTVGLDVQFLLTERALVTVSLESEDGSLVRTLAENHLIHAGPQRVKYEVPTSEIPCQIANCKYRITIEARPTYSSRDYFSVTRSGPIRGL